MLLFDCMYYSYTFLRLQLNAIWQILSVHIWFLKCSYLDSFLSCLCGIPIWQNGGKGKGMEEWHLQNAVDRWINSIFFFLPLDKLKIAFSKSEEIYITLFFSEAYSLRWMEKIFLGAQDVWCENKGKLLVMRSGRRV